MKQKEFENITNRMIEESALDSELLKDFTSYIVFNCDGLDEPTIVSYKTDRFFNVNLVIALVKSLVRRSVDLRGAIIHSDMGWTYTNRVYVDYMKKSVRTRACPEKETAGTTPASRTSSVSLSQRPFGRRKNCSLLKR